MIRVVIFDLFLLALIVGLLALAVRTWRRLKRERVASHAEWEPNVRISADVNFGDTVIEIIRGTERQTIAYVAAGDPDHDNKVMLAQDVAMQRAALMNSMNGK